MREVRLSPVLRERFYQKMKSVIVYIQTKCKTPTYVSPKTKREFKRKHHRSSNIEEKEALMVGGGIFLNECGWILTCSHVVPENPTSIEYSHVDDLESNWGATVVMRNDRLDLVVLRPIDSQYSFDYATFGDLIEVGMEVLAISHPSFMRYTYTVGEVTFPSFRRMEDVRDNKKDKDLLSYDKKLKVIPINNFHGLRGSSGAPVFDSQGRVIGLISFIVNNLDFAIHVTTLKEFWESAQVHLKDEERKREPGR